jgi:hypothetical protein
MSDRDCRGGEAQTAADSGSWPARFSRSHSQELEAQGEGLFWNRQKTVACFPLEVVNLHFSILSQDGKHDSKEKKRYFSVNKTVLSLALALSN